MTRQGRENLFVGVLAAAIGAWWITKSRGGVGGHKVGQDLASYLRRGFGLPQVRIEVPPWRRRYYPAAESSRPYMPMFPSGYRSTYPQSYQSYQTQPSQPPAAYQPPVTYRSFPMPGQSVHPSGVQALPLPRGSGRPDFANRWRVEKAQHALNAIYGNLLEEDGLMGPKTVDVIQMFQKEQGLPTTGVMDDRTQAALDAAPSQPAPQASNWWDWAEHPSEAAG